MQVPDIYIGREQSYLKHKVLYEYLIEWGIKLASPGTRRQVRLCYVDAFSGPWKARGANLEDTSIAIGIKALRAASETWGDGVKIEAFFVEKDPLAFVELERFVASQPEGIEMTRRCGEFGSHIEELNTWLRRDAAFIFVDPTGWKGAAMKFIAPLMKEPRRDVLVNVMFDHINRFKDDPRPFLRQQMRDFFGLAESNLPEMLDEEDLFQLYRENLKTLCGVKYAADLAIPHPTDDRTKFRLVVGGSSPAVLELFRRIEAKVIGREAATVREMASIRKTEEKTGQGSLFIVPPAVDRSYMTLHEKGLNYAPKAILKALHEYRAVPFRDVWPKILEAHHITKVELARIAWDLYREGKIKIVNLKPRQRTVRDDTIVIRT
ncbi:MAG: three-Cys-motif partner protein TcmP [Cyanobacteriota bacterium]